MTGHDAAPGLCRQAKSRDSMAACNLRVVRNDRLTSHPDEALGVTGVEPRVFPWMPGCSPRIPMEIGGKYWFRRPFQPISNTQ